MHKEAIITHFSFNDLSKSEVQSGTNTDMVAGAETVMKVHEQVLTERGWNVQYVLGSGSRKDFVLVPEIASGKNIDIDPAMEDKIILALVAKLGNIFDGNPVMAHNTTNARRHNPAFGKAIAQLAERRLDDIASPIIIWSHDSRGATQQDLQSFVPARKQARVVCVSNSRREELLQRLSEMRSSGAVVPDNEAVVTIYNPINQTFVRNDYPAPANLTQVAPNATLFNSQHELLYSHNNLEYDIFDPNSDVMNFILPARIVPQKAIERAVVACHAYSELTGQRTNLVVTGPPDSRRPESLVYWETVAKISQENNSSKFTTNFLGGVDMTYIPWLYSSESTGTKNKLIIFPSKNEGFGYPPSEAACVRTASIVTDLPALLETTQGNALVVPEGDWHKPDVVSKKFASYIHSSRPRIDAYNLKGIALRLYSTDAIGKQIEEILS